MSRVLVSLVAAALPACGSVDLTPAGDLTGMWSYVATSLSGGSWHCQLVGLDIELSQSPDGGLSGTTVPTAGAKLFCQDPAGERTVDYESFGKDLWGRVAGSTVRMNGPGFFHVGELLGDRNRIEGSVGMEVVLRNRKTELRGPFVMTRQ